MSPVPQHLHLLQHLIRIGSLPQMSYQERRRVVVLNIAGLSGGVCSLFFLVANCFNGYWLLCWLDVLTLAGGWSVVYFHRRGLYRYPPLIISSLFSVCCAVSSFFYHNSTEYFLLLFLGVNFIVWDRMRVALVYAVFNGLLFFLLQLNRLPPAALAVPAWNKGVVLVIGLGLYIYFLYYFKLQTQRYQQQIERQNKDLQQSNRHNQQVMSVISHDFRSPIGNVYTSLMMLRDGQLSREEFDAITGRLLLQVGNLNSNVDMLLEWGKHQLHVTSPVKAVVAVGPLVGAVLDFLSFQAEAKGVGIRVEVAEGLLLYADADEVSIVLRNLVSNAVKFSFPGTKVVVSGRQAGAYVYIGVRDSGVGMSPEQLAGLFDEGRVVVGYGTENEKGNGLGLLLSREFAVRNGGDIELVSNGDGAGITATLVVPGVSRDGNKKGS